MRLVDRSGETFGKLTVLSRASNAGRRTTWLCRCECGNEATVRTEALTQGFTKSCGCVRRETTSLRSVTHGHSVGRRSSKTLRAYAHAKARCNNPNDKKYPQYGGRGIRFCERWTNSAVAFISDMGECPDGHSLDRIDVNGDYEPSNCRWANTRTQSRNRTDNVYVEADGRKVVLKDYAADNGLNYKRLHWLFRTKGMPIEDAARLSRMAL